MTFEKRLEILEAKVTLMSQSRVNPYDIPVQEQILARLEMLEAGVTVSATKRVTELEIHAPNIMARLTSLEESHAQMRKFKAEFERFNKVKYAIKTYLQGQEVKMPGNDHF